MDKLLIDSDDDGDVNDPAELTSTFNIPYQLDSEVAVATQKIYILHMNGTIISSPRIAVALSDFSCAVYDATQLKKVEKLCGHKGTVSNIRFSPTDEHVLFSSSLDGTIKLWDIRTGNKSVKELKDDTEGPEKLKPLSDFDISCNGRFICAGTELIEEDAFLLFWDVRSMKLLGGYWESHTDDITQVCFHPTKQDMLASGSTDGLINVFDISKTSEDDAIQHSLNTESSVNKIRWFVVKDGDNLSCITHTEDLQLWRTDGAFPFLHFSRNVVSESMQRRTSESCCLIDVHQTNTSNELLLLAGSTAGQGECLRTLAVHKILKPLSNLEGNQQIVRTSWYDKRSEVLITGGESGILSLWKPGTSSTKETSTNLKMHSTQKLQLHQKRPY